MYREQLLADFVRAAAPEWRQRFDQAGITVAFEQASRFLPDFTIVANGKRFGFHLSQSPFNSREVMDFVDNKWALYQAEAASLNMPFTLCFNKTDGKSTESWIADILGAKDNDGVDMRFPLVVKPNQGSRSVNVSIVQNEQELKSAIDAVRAASGQGDKVLVQKYIGPAKEYRVICFEGDLVYAYEKNIDDASRGHLANPSYWPGSKYILLQDPAMKQKFQEFAQCLHKRHGVNYVGFDIRVTEAGIAHVLEANSSPMGMLRFYDTVKEGPEIIKGLLDRMVARILRLSAAQADSEAIMALEAA